ncbi:hypothetical protein [Robertmurraya massiliosenegalensis]|uniref:hypothetical protein n=1 Tax=Robertmurraya massiliosenegalensis TaxID=1287657 RepID=UPI000304133B|nr:hypothetical protein [Robertmurraya massiliosenegalensis]
MNSKMASLIGIGIVVLLLIEIVGSMITARIDEEKKNPIDKNGMLKDGYSISSEEEAEMSKNSYPTVSDTEYHEQLMYAICQCILTAKALESYECIGNNIVDSYFDREDLTENEKGEIIYKMFMKGYTPTGVEAKLINGEGDENEQTYEITIATLENKTPFIYTSVVKERKIQSITEFEENLISIESEGEEK